MKFGFHKISKPFEFNRHASLLFFLEDVALFIISQKSKQVTIILWEMIWTNALTHACMLRHIGAPVYRQTKLSQCEKSITNLLLPIYEFW